MICFVAETNVTNRRTDQLPSFRNKEKFPILGGYEMKTGALLAVIFMVVFAVLHLLRLLFGLTIVIGGITVPLWVSILAFLVSGILAVMLWREGKR